MIKKYECNESMVDMANVMGISLLALRTIRKTN
jgi:hypothetical protein